MSHIVCSLCTCRLDWSSMNPDALQCESCGHSLDDDHVAMKAAATPEPLEERALPLPIFVGRRVI